VILTLPQKQLPEGIFGGVLGVWLSCLGNWRIHVSFGHALENLWFGHLEAGLVS
jgi:hypothetical protein